jgi:hypothetical protein
VPDGVSNAPTVATQAAGGPVRQASRLWQRLRNAVSWTPPTSTEVGTIEAITANSTVVKSGRSAIEHDQEPGADELDGEWLGHAALLVQVDRIVGDLSAPLPT